MILHANAHGHTVADANWAKDNYFHIEAGMLPCENSCVFLRYLTCFC